MLRKFDRATSWLGLTLLLWSCARSHEPSSAGSSHEPAPPEPAALGATAVAPQPRPAQPPLPPASVGPSSVPHPIANPLISRNKPVFGHSLANFSEVKAVNDGAYRTWSGSWHAGTPKPNEPAWAAIRVGTGYKKLLLVWADSGSYNFNETTYGAPADYRIDVSADSSDGADGTWSPVAAVEKNIFHAREHSFVFEGKSWVKLVLLRAPENSPNGIVLDEIEVHDLSAGGTDTWLFMGDSITANNYDRQSEHHQPSFAELVHRGNARYFPAMINAGIGGENSKDAVAHVDDWLAVAPDFKYWAIGYGTNDAAGNSQNSAGFESNMQTVIKHILAAGRVPILARIPYSSDGSHDHIASYNEAIDRLTKQNNLGSGPDLYDWFVKHPDQLADKLHPGEDKLHPPANGIVEANRLWWEAVRWLYAS